MIASKRAESFCHLTFANRLCESSSSGVFFRINGTDITRGMRSLTDSAI